VGGRHADVDDHEVGAELADESEQLVGVARLADDVELGALEQARQTLAQEDVVLSEGDTAPARGCLDRASTLRAWSRIE
jgi:hypothetical protein